MTVVDAHQLLTGTRSTRRSLDLRAPVDLDEIRECLRIGLQAPSGSNQQAWRWVVLTGKHLRARVAGFYRQAYLGKVGGQLVAGLVPEGTPERRLMSSTEWLVEHMGDVPALVIPCYEPMSARSEGDESFHQATLYGSIFPAVWNFQLALRARGYGSCITTLHLHHEVEIRALLGIPDSYVQGCLLPVARLRNNEFRRAPRRPLTDVLGLNGCEIEQS